MTDERPHFDVIVVGAGMMGSAAARHLAEMGVKVALIGPDEPKRKKTHSGVFASHYDQARITRRLDSNADWSRLATAAISRYSSLEIESGRHFFNPVGSIIAGPEAGLGSEFILETQRVGIAEGTPFYPMRGHELCNQFPFFSFPDGILALYEEIGAGWVNPREFVAAEIISAHKIGVSIHREEVLNINDKTGHSLVTCADGAVLLGAKVMVACGAFSRDADLLFAPIPLKVYARTVTFFEIGFEMARRLKDMPSVVYRPPDLSCDPYILPPVKYSDGKIYLKIGGDPKDVELKTANDVKDWCRQDGDGLIGSFLADQLLNLMPGLNYNSITFGSCVTSYTPTGKPLIYAQSDSRIVLTGGNGASAKCADELGRLAAMLATEGDLSAENYEASFGVS